MREMCVSEQLSKHELRQAPSSSFFWGPIPADGFFSKLDEQICAKKKKMTGKGKGKENEQKRTKEQEKKSENI